MLWFWIIKKNTSLNGPRQSRYCLPLTTALIVGYSYRIRERNPPPPVSTSNDEISFYQPAVMSAARPTRSERRPHENQLVFISKYFLSFSRTCALHARNVRRILTARDTSRHRLRMRTIIIAYTISVGIIVGLPTCILIYMCTHACTDQGVRRVL